jgi:hypothetical protein
MIHWVHRDTTHRWSNSPPTLGAGLTQLTQRILLIADLSNYSSALEVNAANFARAQP